MNSVAPLKVALLRADVRHVMGQQTYELELTRSLQELAIPDLEVSEVRVSSLRSSLDSELKLPMRIVTEAPLIAQRTVMRSCLRRFGLVHRMDLRLPASSVEVVTVHDLAPLHFPDEGSLPARAAASLRRARSVIAPSSFAAEDIAEALQIERPSVIPYGVPSDAFGAEPLDERTQDSLGINGRYVLHCGGVTRRKNLEGLRDAWTILRGRLPEIHLVLAGPVDPRRTDLFEGDGRVITPGRVDRRVLLALMTSADAVVVPSLYEGYGFPAVEAMACGTPVVAANMASLPEVCGDAALLSDVDPEGMAHAMEQVLQDDRLRDRLIAAGRARAATLTWESTAQQHLAVYRRSLEDS
jgi:glycosyltransferase involved in cell wall biosynthesis